MLFGFLGWLLSWLTLEYFTITILYLRGIAWVLQKSTAPEAPFVLMVFSRFLPGSPLVAKAISFPSFRGEYSSLLDVLESDGWLNTMNKISRYAIAMNAKLFFSEQQN